MRKLPMMAVVVAVTLASLAAFSQFSQADPTEEATIKKVMKEAMKGGLNKKVISGKASDAEKKHLLELYESMHKATPEKGDETSWNTKTTALVKGASAAVDGKADAPALLKKASDCKSCHNAHK